MPICESCGGTKDRRSISCHPCRMKTRHPNTGKRRLEISSKYRTVKTEEGTKYEHRLIMELKLGRKLQDKEVVHHIDGDKKNNSPENLELLTMSEHAKQHMLERNLTELSRLGHAARWGK